ncbi:MAG: filamentous hemagglutinin N-terminal protein [Rhodospirillales bacterium]|nr:filamentous hemagglutinin N-terminal protein [Rhodospirillales bacterium]
MLLATTCLVAAGPLVYGATPGGAPTIQPTGGSVAGGQATINQTSTQTTITQSSDKAIINWGSFSIGAGSTVTFAQPNSSSITLNRVAASGGRSNIDGNLNANGQVWIVNPSGVIFGRGAAVSVGGLIATTADIRDQDFYAGSTSNCANNNSCYAFSQATNAAIVNDGTIQTNKPGGSIVLASTNVKNTGLIQADFGTVQLAAGKSFAVDFHGDKLISFQVKAEVDQAPDSHGKPVDALITNTGTLSANGGRVALTARAAKNVIDNVINTTGIVEATTAKSVNGEIVFDGGDNGVVQVAGLVNASGTVTGQTGGSVTMTGHGIELIGAARIDVSGDAGGGTALIGGAAQGAKLPIQRATTVVAASGSRITADALTSGNGGTVVLASDGSTLAAGSVSARGGKSSGSGGYVETSSKGSLRVAASASVAIGASHGNAGQWLLAERNIMVGSHAHGGEFDWGWTFDEHLPFGNDATVGAGTLAATLNGGANITLAANGSGSFAGDITIASTIVKTTSGGSSLTMNAGGAIALNAPIVSTAGQLSVNLNAADKTTVAAGITTAGGSFTSTSDRFVNTAAIYAQDGAISINADAVSIAASIHTAGALALAPVSDATTVGIGTASGAFQLSSSELPLLDFGSLTIGKAADANGHGGTQSVSIGGALSSGIGRSQQLGSVTIQAGRNGTITLQSNTTIATNKDLTFATGTGGLITLGTGASVTSASKSISFDGAVNVSAGTATIDTTASGTSGGASISFLGPVNGATANTANLVLAAGQSNVLMTRGIGGTKSLKTLTLRSGNAYFGGAVRLGTSYVDQRASGTSLFDSSLTAPSVTIAGSGTTISGGLTASSLSLASRLTSSRVGVSDAVTVASDAAAIDTSAANGAVALGTIDGAHTLSLTSGNGAMTLGTVGGTTALTGLTIATGADLTLPAIRAGTLSVTDSNGLITQSGALKVAGIATLAAGSGDDITLTNAGNDFSTVAIASGRNVALTDVNAVALGTSTMSGTLSVTGGSIGLGNVTTGGSQTYTGATTIAAGSALVTSGGAVTFQSRVTLGGDGSNVTNAAIDTTNNGIASAGATITFGGTLDGSAETRQNLTLAAGSGGDVVFHGRVGQNNSNVGTRLGTLGIASARNVALAMPFGSGGDGLSVGSLAIGTMAMPIHGSVTASSYIDVVTSGAMAPNVTINAAGDVSVAGNIIAVNNDFGGGFGGNVTIVGGGAVAIGTEIPAGLGSDAIFASALDTIAAGQTAGAGGSVNITGKSISVLAGISARGGDAKIAGSDGGAGGSVTLTATNGNVSLGGLGSGASAGATTRGGDSLTGHGGAAGAITISGTRLAVADLVARGGDSAAVTAGFGGAAAKITLTASAASGDAVVLYGNAAWSDQGDARTLVARGGKVGVTAFATDATPGVDAKPAGGGTLDGNGADVTIQGAGAAGSALAGSSDIRLATSAGTAAGVGSLVGISASGGSVDGTVSLLGPIVGTTAGKESLSLLARNGTIRLPGAIGSVATPLAGVTIAAGTDLMLPTVHARTLTVVDSNGSITQGAGTNLTLTGAATFATAIANDITLGNAGNRFARVAIASGRNVVLANAGDLQLAGISASGTLSVSSGGAISEAAGSSVVAAGATLSAVTAIALANGGNDFDRGGGAASLTASGASVQLTDANGLQLGNVTSLGTLSVAAGGAVTQAAGTNLAVAGTSTISGSSITLTQSTNSFGGALSLATLGAGNNISVAAVQAPTLGTVSVGTGGSLALSYGSGALSLGQSLTTSGGSISLGAVNLTSDVTLSTVGGGAAGADVSMGTLDGLHALTVAAGSGNTTIGPIGGTSTVAKLVLQGGGADSIAIRKLMLLDLAGKPGGSVIETGFMTKLGDVFTAGAGYSISFTGGGLIGDPTFSNTGGVSFNGSYDIPSGLLSTGSITTLSGSIDAHDAAIHLGSIVDIGPVTLTGSSVTIDGPVSGPAPTIVLPPKPKSSPPPFIPPPPPPPSNPPPSNPGDSSGGSGGTPPGSSTPPGGTGNPNTGLDTLNPQAGGGPDGGSGLSDGSPPTGYDGTADNLGQTAGYTPLEGSGGGGSGSQGSNGQGGGSGKKQAPVAIIPGLVQSQGSTGPSGGNGGGGNGDVSSSPDPGGWTQ